MEMILYIFGKMPMGILGFFFLILFFILSFTLYAYVSFNLKGILKIMFNDEKHFRLPLEPFNYFFISVLPIVFWRELLNKKKGIAFSKLYQKDFYYSINEKQLSQLIENYPVFFYVQYLIFLSGLLFCIFISSSYLFELKS